MEFNSIKEEIKKISFEELRNDCDNYFEGVLVKAELEVLNQRLKVFFGEPAWPSAGRLAFKAKEATDRFGGIMPGQTLYFRSEGQDEIFAMLWSWQDGMRTTIKLIQNK